LLFELGRITYTDIILVAVKNSVIIDQDYDPRNIESAVNVSDVTFSNIHGTAVGQYAITLNCAYKTACNNIVMEHINITTVDGGEARMLCTNANIACSSCYPNVTCLASTNFGVENFLEYPQCGSGLCLFLIYHSISEWISDNNPRLGLNNDVSSI